MQELSDKEEQEEVKWTEMDLLHEQEPVSTSRVHNAVISVENVAENNKSFGEESLDWNGVNLEMHVASSFSDSHLKQPEKSSWDSLPFSSTGSLDISPKQRQSPHLEVTHMQTMTKRKLLKDKGTPVEQPLELAQSPHNRKRDLHSSIQSESSSSNFTENTERQVDRKSLWISSDESFESFKYLTNVLEKQDEGFDEIRQTLLILESMQSILPEKAVQEMKELKLNVDTHMDESSLLLASAFENEDKRLEEIGHKLQLMEGIQSILPDKMVQEMKELKLQVGTQRDKGNLLIGLLRNRKTTKSQTEATKEENKTPPLNIEGISNYLFGRPQPPNGCDYLIQSYYSAYMEKGSDEWTNLEEATWFLIAGTCKILPDVENHAGLRCAYLESVDSLFKSLKVMIQKGKEL
jgi:hypothetical protein